MEPLARKHASPNAICQCDHAKWLHKNKGACIGIAWTGHPCPCTSFEQDPEASGT